MKGKECPKGMHSMKDAKCMKGKSMVATDVKTPKKTTKKGYK